MTDQATPLIRRDLVEQNIGKVFPTPPAVGVSERTGGLAFQTMGDIIEAAKMMSMSGPMIPKWLQGNPGGCWAIIVQANQWRFDPVTVGRMSYCVASQDGESVGYMSQLIHALVEARAPLKRRLRFEFQGEGEDRVCLVTIHVRGEDEPLHYQTPPIRLITPKRSPLWKSDPDQQLSYYAARALCRRHFPDVLMGVYDRDELEGEVIDQPGGRDVTEAANALHERLKAATASGEGFGPGVVENGLGEPAEAAGEPEPAAPVSDSPSEARRATGRPKTAREPAAPKPPKTAAQYAKHVAAWVRDMGDEASIEEQWRRERTLRNQCGVTAEEKDQMRAAIVDLRISQIRVAI